MTLRSSTPSTYRPFLFLLVAVIAVSPSVFLSGCTGGEASSICPAQCDADCDGVVDADCSVAETIRAGAGGVLEIRTGPLAGFALDIPPGALAEDTEVSLRVTAATDLETRPWDREAERALFLDALSAFPEMVGNWSEVERFPTMFMIDYLRHEGLGASDLTFELLPNGLLFDVPARLTLPYTAEGEGARALPSALRIAQWSTLESGERLLSNTTVDADQQLISADISHFSSHQVKPGFAEMFHLIGAELLFETPGQGLSLLLPESPANKVPHTSVTPDQLREATEALAREVVCGLDSPWDDSIPSDVRWNELMAHLSTMPSLFTPGDDSPPGFLTGQEGALSAAVDRSEVPVSFAEMFQESMGLNRGNVFQSFMTMHNLGRSIYDLRGKLAPLTHLHGSITDTEGAYYHMAGLALLTQYTGSTLPAIFSAYMDEVGIGKLVSGNFDEGDLISNLIGVHLLEALEAARDRGDVCVIVVSAQSGAITTEDGGAVTFDVALGANPGPRTVVIALTSTDPSEGSVAPLELSFDDRNWDAAQTVTVTGLPDAIVDGDVSYQVLLEPRDGWAPSLAIDLTNTEEPLPVVTFDVDTWTRPFTRTGTRAVEGTYPEDPIRRLNALSDGTIVRREGGTSPETPTTSIDGRGWNVELVSTLTYRMTGDFAYTGGAHLPLTLSITDDFATTLTIDIKIDGVTYQSLSFADSSERVMDAAQMYSDAPVDSASGMYATRTHHVSRVVASSVDGAQQMRVYVARTDRRVIYGLADAGMTITEDRATTQTTYEIVLSDDGAGGVVQTIENEVPIMTVQHRTSESNSSSNPFFMLTTDRDIGGLPGAITGTSLSTTMATSATSYAYTP